MDSIQLSEELMRRGWWDAARSVLDRNDVAPADRTLQLAALSCRYDCAAWFAANRLQATSSELERQARIRFDKYTVYWVLHYYIGDCSAQWLKDEKANAPTD